MWDTMRNLTDSDTGTIKDSRNCRTLESKVGHTLMDGTMFVKPKADKDLKDALSDGVSWRERFRKSKHRMKGGTFA